MCGIFSVIARENLGSPCLPASFVANGEYMLLHRGQEAAGLSVYSNNKITTFKTAGQGYNVPGEEVVCEMPGKFAIGHVRYGTTGGSTEDNAQPHHKNGHFEVAVSHNGNLVNTVALRKELEQKGSQFRSTSDTEVIAEMIATSNEPTIEKAVIATCMRLQGAYSLLILTHDKVIAVRDPYGIRPLSLGRLNNGEGEFYMLSSETCAFNFFGTRFIRDIDPGEMLVIDNVGMYSQSLPVEPTLKLCIFELVYFARPDSWLMGQRVYHARANMGRILAEECQDPRFDMIAPIPTSGVPAANGFAEYYKQPTGTACIKNNYVARTFIDPSSHLRKNKVRLKLIPLEEEINGKRIASIDDSIVRGNTCQQQVKMLKDCGAKEVHPRISSPPVISPCFYGIDTATRDELIAANMGVEETAHFLSADSLRYLSLEGMIRATGCPADNFCLACFKHNDYPIPINPDEIGKNRLE